MGGPSGFYPDINAPVARKNQLHFRRQSFGIDSQTAFISFLDAIIPL